MEVPTSPLAASGRASSSACPLSKTCSSWQRRAAGSLPRRSSPAPPGRRLLGAEASLLLGTIPTREAPLPIDDVEDYGTLAVTASLNAFSRCSSRAARFCSPTSRGYQSPDDLARLVASTYAHDAQDRWVRPCAAPRPRRRPGSAARRPCIRLAASSSCTKYIALPDPAPWAPNQGRRAHVGCRRRHAPRCLTRSHRGTTQPKCFFHSLRCNASSARLRAAAPGSREAPSRRRERVTPACSC